MTDDFYFIPILARALAQRPSAGALSEAFAEIQRLGRQERYTQGFQQFQQFMAAAAQPNVQCAEDREALLDVIVQGVIRDLAAGTFEGGASGQATALELIESRLAWRGQYEQAMRGELDKAISEGRFIVLLEDDGNNIRSLELSSRDASGDFGGIAPGHYRLSLDTGLLLWQGELAPSDLIWAEAFPDEPFEMAAATGEFAGRATVDEALLGGELRLRVFPGIESGTLRIELKPHGG